MSHPRFDDLQSSRPPDRYSGVVRLLITTGALVFLGARYGVDQATELAPAVASTVDTVGRWFGKH